MSLQLQNSMLAFDGCFYILCCKVLHVNLLFNIRLNSMCSDMQMLTSVCTSTSLFLQTFQIHAFGRHLQTYKATYSAFKVYIFVSLCVPLDLIP